jgi:hypothetical protein
MNKIIIIIIIIIIMDITVLFSETTVDNGALAWYINFTSS